jgi:hypothetical protein
MKPALDRSVLRGVFNAVLIEVVVIGVIVLAWQCFR